MDAIATFYKVSGASVKPAQAAPPINGYGRTYKKLSKSQKAALGVAVLRGEASLQPTLKIVSRALEVSVSYLEIATHCSPDQLRQLRQGELTVAEVKPAPRREPIALVDVITWLQAASDAERAEIVRQVGIAPTWDAIAANLD